MQTLKLLCNNKLHNAVRYGKLNNLLCSYTITPSEELTLLSSFSSNLTFKDMWHTGNGHRARQ